MVQIQGTGTVSIDPGNWWVVGLLALISLVHSMSAGVGGSRSCWA
jgi:hypothetical protein